MLKIRLSRAGKKSQPSFRVVVQEHSSPIKGKFIEEVGTYLPATKEKQILLKLERVKYWLSVGAQPSDSVAVLLKKEGVDGMDKFIAPRDKQKKKKNAEEEAPAEEAPKSEAPAEEAKPAEAAAPEAETPKEEAKPQEPAATEEPPAEDPPKSE